VQNHAQSVLERVLCKGNVHEKGPGPFLLDRG
jgi:hypothetical protein